MKIDVFEFDNKVGEVDLSVLTSKSSEAVVYRAVVATLANRRQGTASTLTKSEVRGGGKKPWRQKGLGRARAGSIRSPLWRGGGVIFGPKPRDYSKKVNKKEKVLAYISVFTQHFNNGSLKIVKDFSVSSMKTKDFVKSYASYLKETEGRKVFVISEYDENILLATRNLPDVFVVSKDSLDLLPLFYADKVFLFQSAALSLDERFKQVVKE
ncbi:MAG: 50S ribosomal protein L4 [Brevinematales bacterium]|nr:50S ribosomal protein L4 [Brevinematales bacterium]